MPFTSTSRLADLPEDGAPEKMLESAFLTAYLLTGSAAASQASVEEAIEAWDPHSGPPALMREAVAAALAREIGHSHDVSVPAPLRRVMELPASMRRCFILRCLVGLTASVTGALLSLSRSQVDRYTRGAMSALATQVSGAI